MEKMAIYDAARSVPESACRRIEAGRLKGKTDINPMWRIKRLTELFGPCGVGWKYEIVRFWSEDGAGGEKAAFAEIRLYIKQGDAWSDAIPGVGGSALVSKEKNGLYTSDECYKMALTDAISVSCKALGIGADIYWDKDTTKYAKKCEHQQMEKPLVCEACGREVADRFIADGTLKAYGRVLCRECGLKEKRKRKDKNLEHEAQMEMIDARRDY